jgi:hypothetical protein
MTAPKKQPNAAAKPKAKAKPKAGAMAKAKAEPSREAIALRAYGLSQERGDGDHVAHWLEAERELTGR